MPGAGTSSQQQQSSQSSQTAPWAPAQAELEGILTAGGGLGTSVTPGQSSAYGILNNEAGAVPSYSAPASNLATNLFNYNTTPQQGTLTGANANLNTELSPYLSSSYLNPTSTPGLSTALSGLNNSITNNINDQFAAAGETGSPANSEALAYGLSTGEAPLITNEFNTLTGNQLGAANTAFNAAGTTASGLTAQQLAAIQANSGGVGVAGSIPQLALAPGSTQLGVSTAQAQQPYQNLGWLASLIDPIAALGSQSSGTSSTTGSSTASPLQDLDMISNALGGSSYNPATGATSASGISGFLFSDERLKEDIEPVGELYDGTNVYSYRYKGDSTPRIGLIAQEVEAMNPDAVIEIGPARIKAVDYGRATETSRHIGLLHEYDLAA
jgi:hypothetical protein